MSLKRRTNRSSLFICCLLWSSLSLLLADGGNGGLGPAASLSAYAPWQLLRVSTRFGGFSPYPTFIERQSPSRRNEADDSQQCHQAGMCSASPAATADVRVPGDAAASTSASNPAAQLQAQQPQLQQVQEMRTQQQQQQQLVEPSSQQPQAQGIQQQHSLQDSSQVQPQQPEQHSSTPVAEANTQQQPATAETSQQPVPVTTAPTQPAVTPVPAPGTAAVPAPAGQQQQQQQQRPPIPPPSPVRRLLNLAELSDGASVLAANPEAKKPERAIDKDIDSFMKNDCNAHKWMIIELSQLGTVETVKLTMKELYSSRVHTFRVFGRSSHPRKDGPDLTASLASEAWQLLGSFTAENKRGTQAFSLPQRSRVRYLLLTFDTHYGSEAMCAMNWIEVLGVSAAQELEEALALQELEAEGEEHEQQQQQLFAAQQLEQIKLQQQQQLTPAAQQQPAAPQQQVLVQDPASQQLQQQAEAAKEQRTAVPAAAAPDTTPVDAATGSAQVPVSAPGAGVTGPSAPQQPVPGSPATFSQAAEQQQQEPATEATQQAGQESSDAVAGGASMATETQQGASAAGSAVVAGVTGSAAGLGPLADGAASATGQLLPATTAGNAAAVAAAAAAATPQQLATATSDLSASAGVDGSPPGAAPDVHQQQQLPTASMPAAAHGAALDDGKQQRALQPQNPLSNGNAAGSDTAAAALIATQPVQSGSDAAADTCSSSVPAVPSTDQQPSTATAGTVVACVDSDAQAPTPAAASSATTAAPVDQLRTAPAAGSDATAAAAVAPPAGTVATDVPVVSGGGTDVAAGAAEQTAAGAGAAGAVPSTPSSGETAAASQQQQQQQAPPLQQQQAVPPQQQQQQQQPTVVPQQRQQQKAPAREGASVLEGWSSTAKPKQAGNLFDIIKSEMMQMKLDQSKVSKKLDGLSKRSSDFEAVVALLQQQHAQVLAQIENLTGRLEKVAEQQQQQAAAARQFMTHHHPMPGPAGAAAPGGPGVLHHPHLHHPHMQSAGRSMPGHGMGAGPSIPVCESHLHQQQLLLVQPQFQWGIVTALSLTCVLGLSLLLHPRCALLPGWLRVAVCCLVVFNGVLAGLLGVWLLVVQSLLLGPAVVQVPAGPLVPTHRMLGSSAWQQP